MRKADDNCRRARPVGKRIQGSTKGVNEIRLVCRGTCAFGRLFGGGGDCFSSKVQVNIWQAPQKLFAELGAAGDLNWEESFPHSAKPQLVARG